MTKPLFTAYFDDEFEACEEADATLAKIVFADGSNQFVNLNQKLKFNPYHEPAGAVTETGEPAGGRFAEAEGGPAGVHPATKKLEAASDYVLDVTDHPEEGCVGFLTPEGHALSITPPYHALVAQKAGVSLYDVMYEGTKRMYAYKDFLGVEANNPLTSAQINTLAKFARTGAYERFAIESIGPNKQVTFGPGQVTPQVVRRLVNESMGK